MGGVSTLSEISELTRKIDAFILKISPVIGSHSESIDACKGERGIINKTLFDKKNGMTVKVSNLETTLKGKQSTFAKTISILTVLFMGGIFIMWLVRTISEKVGG